MNFWIIAVVLLAVSAAAISWPLFTGSTKDRIIAILVLLVIPVAGLVLYQNIGTPEAIDLPAARPQQTAQTQQPHSSQAAEMEVIVAQLQQRMAENPDDPEGWLILGRTLKTMQRYAEAITALSNANRLVPGTPLIIIELAEAKLFASEIPEITAEIKQLIESALAIDPHQQKGLWLLGMVAAEEGDDALVGLHVPLLENVLDRSGDHIPSGEHLVLDGGGRPVYVVMLLAVRRYVEPSDRIVRPEQILERVDGGEDQDAVHL